MRLFIAIQLSKEMRRLVKDVQETFRRQHVKGNYSPEENLHITLAFIGEYGNPDEVLEVMDTVVFKPFRIKWTRWAASMNCGGPALRTPASLRTLSGNCVMPWQTQGSHLIKKASKRM